MCCGRTGLTSGRSPEGVYSCLPALIAWAPGDHELLAIMSSCANAGAGASIWHVSNCECFSHHTKMAQSCQLLLNAVGELRVHAQADCMRGRLADRRLPCRARARSRCCTVRGGICSTCTTAQQQHLAKLRVNRRPPPALTCAQLQAVLHVSSAREPLPHDIVVPSALTLLKSSSCPSAPSVIRGNAREAVSSACGS